MVALLPVVLFVVLHLTGLSPTGHRGACPAGAQSSPDRLRRHLGGLAWRDRRVLTIAAALLLLHPQVVDHVVEAAARAPLSSTDMSGLRVQLVVDAALAIAVLLTTTALSVAKPHGFTRDGRRTRTLTS
ncbi:hypothetical protein ACFWQL_00825 [Amycolatopsis thermoflava]|uniref:hypothetical protein n=1 Tax=Amycolatopsis thermoflava TaxID=84480 RepID=UPI00364B858C